MTTPVHPEIPPNCPHFIEYDGVWHFRTTAVLAGFPIREDILTGSRFTVACVAEVAWRKEKERLKNLDTDYDSHSDYTQQLLYDIREAEKHIDEWREWGEKRGSE